MYDQNRDNQNTAELIQLIENTIEQMEPLQQALKRQLSGLKASSKKPRRYKKSPSNFTDENGYKVLEILRCSKDGHLLFSFSFGENHPLNSSMPNEGRECDIKVCIKAISIACENKISKLKIKSNLLFVPEIIKHVDFWERYNWERIPGIDIYGKLYFMKLADICKQFEDISWELIQEQPHRIQARATRNR